MVTSIEEKDDGIYATFDTINTSNGVAIDAIMEHTPYGNDHVLAINGFVKLDENAIFERLDLISLRFKLRDDSTTLE